jgi:alpha-N-arabinofuranosidase
MAEYAQTVNVIGCIKTTKTSAFFDTTALPLMLYRREFGTESLPVSSNTNEQSLDVAAAKTADGDAITIGVVNPEKDSRKIKLDVKGANLGSKATVWRITADSPEATNTADKQQVQIVESRDIAVDGSLTVPPYSANVYRIPLK